MYICDSHLHSSWSADSDAAPEMQIKRAIELGMKEICITDHHDYDVNSGDLNFNLPVADYFEYFNRLKEIYSGQIRINIGIELGLQEHIADYLCHLADSYPFDLIIGSNHYIHGLDPYYPEFFHGKSTHDAYRDYFEVVLRRVKKLSCFDVLGHLDYILRYGSSKNRDFSYSSYQDLIDPILTCIIERGQGIECNTGGFRAGLSCPNPDPAVLKRYRELGGEIITIGSDAHRPEDVGSYFTESARLLKEAGFKYYTVFHQRKPLQLPLP